MDGDTRLHEFPTRVGFDHAGGRLRLRLPSAPIPRRRRRKRQIRQPAHGRMAVSAIPHRDQPVRSCNRSRRFAHLQRQRCPRSLRTASADVRSSIASLTSGLHWRLVRLNEHGHRRERRLEHDDLQRARCSCAPARHGLGAIDGAAMGGLILAIRRTAIFVILLAAYGYHAAIGDRYPLASIGLISFCAVAQFAPALLAGLYWRGAHRHGALAGMVGGTLVWAYALLLPSLSEAGWLRPVNMLGTSPLPSVLAGLDPLTNGVFWSLLVNGALLVGVSLFSRHRERDRQQAMVFVAGAEPIEQLNAESLVHGAAFEDRKKVAARFLGNERADRAFSGAVVAYHDKDLAAFAERLLSGAIGAASARIMVAATLRRRGTSAGSTGAILDEASEAILFNRDLLRATLENVSQGIGMFDPTLRLAAWNRRFLELLAVPEHLAQIGTPLEHIVGSCQRAAADTSVDLAMLLPRQNDAELRTQAHTFERRRADGRVLELQTNPMPAGGFVLVCTDVTEPVQTLEALRDSERRIRVYTDNVPVLITYVDRY